MKYGARNNMIGEAWRVERECLSRQVFLPNHFTLIKQQSVSVEELWADSAPWKFDDDLKKEA